VSSDPYSFSDDPYSFDVEPPPAGPSVFTPAPPRDPSLSLRDDQRSRRPEGHEFVAEVDIAEVDERRRPGGKWPARTHRLSRSSLVIMSRRMCYTDVQLIILIHLIDDEPTPLMAKVVGCEYASEGLYRIDADLLPVPRDPDFRAWIARQTSTPRRR
jgi:hypothetical protein